MFLPLEDTLTFTGSSPDNMGTPPLLGAFDFTMSYHINVVGAAVIPLPAGNPADDRTGDQTTLASASRPVTFFLMVMQRPPW